MLVMEYFSRIISRINTLPDYRYHLMCKVHQLTHLTFTDDLMIFCKRTKQSVQRVKDALQYFSSTTGLAANNEKSNIFIAGVNYIVKTKLLEITGFTHGSLPIKYLGLLLSNKKRRKN